MITRGYTWYVCQTHPRSTKYYDMCLDLSQNSKYITVASHVPFEPPDNFSLFEPTEDSFFLHHILDLPPLTTSTESATGGTSTSLTPLKICWLNFKFQSGQFGGTAFAVAHRKVTLLNLHQPNFFGAYDKPIWVVVSMSAYF